MKPQKTVIIPFSWPLKGVDENYARHDQPGLTTPDAKNVWNYDRLRRARGAVRIGTTKVNTVFIGTGDPEYRQARRCSDGTLVNLYHDTATISNYPLAFKLTSDTICYSVDRTEEPTTVPGTIVDSGDYTVIANCDAGDCTGLTCPLFKQARFCEDDTLSGIYLPIAGLVFPATFKLDSNGGACVYVQVSDLSTETPPSGSVPAEGSYTAVDDCDSSLCGGGGSDVLYSPVRRCDNDELAGTWLHTASIPTTPYYFRSAADNDIYYVSGDDPTSTTPGPQTFFGTPVLNCDGDDNTGPDYYPLRKCTDGSHVELYILASSVTAVVFYIRQQSDNLVYYVDHDDATTTTPGALVGAWAASSTCDIINCEVEGCGPCIGGGCGGCQGAGCGGGCTGPGCGGCPGCGGGCTDPTDPGCNPVARYVPWLNCIDGTDAGLLAEIVTTTSSSVEYDDSFGCIYADLSAAGTYNASGTVWVAGTSPIGSCTAVECKRYIPLRKCLDDSVTTSYIDVENIPDTPDNPATADPEDCSALYVDRSDGSVSYAVASGGGNTALAETVWLDSCAAVTELGIFGANPSSVAVSGFDVLHANSATSTSQRITVSGVALTKASNFYTGSAPSTMVYPAPAGADGGSWTIVLGLGSTAGAAPCIWKMTFLNDTNGFGFSVTKTGPLASGTYGNFDAGSWNVSPHTLSVVGDISVG